MTGTDITGDSVPGSNAAGLQSGSQLLNAANDERIVDAEGIPATNTLASAGSSADQGLLQQLCAALARTVFRQFRFPPVIRGLVEALLFSSVFIAAGIISLGIGVKAMLAPMVPFVLLMMFCMVASGVYRDEITHSILNLYIHSIYGFFLASIGVIAMTFVMPVEFSQPKFVFFFLFFAFFVMNTLRPIISGTDFMDGGGRRGN